ncbi:hypothetical protein [Cohnella abietis]|uniref:Uncharacterized protein n=1 Tax=Cohnella abietis TaxID=2507935 RepID=A0A3T1D2A7_9BACL|nr:hypothetical protein [Cohnella abietis]BBI32188.1 hypothetical protein KCTCHS21_15870 [Cohnella abietis]
MAVVICPWCQSEIMQEEGQEPDKICPVCDNEIDGYRTLKLNIGESEEELEDETEEEAVRLSIDEEVDWSEEDDDGLGNTSDELVQFEETVEQLLNEQELVPECPLCHEYMVEAGEQLVSADHFRPRVTDVLGEAIIVAPFTLSMYICPSCFVTHSLLGDSYRQHLVRRFSQNVTDLGSKRN